MEEGVKEVTEGSRRGGRNRGREEVREQEREEERDVAGNGPTADPSV